jgi:hypothetical protein
VKHLPRFAWVSLAAAAALVGCGPASPSADEVDATTTVQTSTTTLPPETTTTQPAPTTTRAPRPTTTTTTTTTMPRVEVPGVVFDTDLPADSDILVAARDGIERAAAYLGVGADLPMTLHLYSTDEGLVDAWERVFSESPNDQTVLSLTVAGGVAQGGDAFVKAEALPSELWYWADTVVHEWYHTVQWNLAGQPEHLPSSVPYWLLEGAATLVTNDTAVWATQRWSDNNDLSGLAGVGRFESTHPFRGVARWETYEALGPEPAGYEVSAAMIIELARVAPGGLNALLVDFYKLRSDGMGTWQADLTAVTGVDVAEFYAQTDATLVASGEYVIAP